MKLFSFILFFLNAFNICAQDKPIIVPFSTNLGDTFLTVEIPEINILEFNNNNEKRYYYNLKKKVLKVYPYALSAKQKLDSLNYKLDSIKKKRQIRRYSKKFAKKIKNEYSYSLKQLTMSEGRILVKLIYRETKLSSYDILKLHRGIFNAFFWQTMAKLWDNNLKTQYDPINNKEDMIIEHILKSN